MSACAGCRSDRVESKCGICADALCRRCRVFLDEEEFPFVRERPAELKHTYYCGPCHQTQVEPFREEYAATLASARQVNVIFRNSKSTVRITKREKAPIRVEALADRDDAILALAFRAAKLGYNAVVNVETSAKKLRNEGWQTSAWSATGVPAELHSRELDR